MKNKHSVFDIELDDDEAELMASLEADEWQTVDNLAEEMAKAKKAAENFLRKDTRVNLRLSKGDLSRLKRRAAYEGVPCQTLMASVLHKFAAGHLIDLAPN